MPGGSAAAYAGGVSGPRVSVRWRFRVGGVFDFVQFPLIGLKLAGVISWPWSMVLLPLWFFLGSLFIIGLGIAVSVGGKRVALLVQDRTEGHTC